MDKSKDTMFNNINEIEEEYPIDESSVVSVMATSDLLNGTGLTTALKGCKQFAEATALKKSGGTVTSLTMSGANIMPKYWYVGGNAYSNSEKNLHFTNNGTSTTNGTTPYKHNCKVYGGNGGSTIAVGFYNTDASKRILAYDDVADCCYSSYPIQHHAITLSGGSGASMTSTATKVAFGTQVGKCGTLLANNGDGGIKVNSGTVQFVEVSGQLAFSNLSAAKPSAGRVSIHLYRGDTIIRTFNQRIPTDASTGAVFTVNFSKLIVKGTLNDVFYIRGSIHGVTGTLVSTNPTKRNYFTVKVMG